MLPAQATLYAALLSNEPFFEERVEFWQSLRAQYGVDLSVFGYSGRCGASRPHRAPSLPPSGIAWAARHACSDAAVRRPLKEAVIETVGPENVLSRPALVAQFDLATVPVATLQELVHFDSGFRDPGNAPPDSGCPAIERVGLRTPEPPCQL